MAFSPALRRLRAGILLLWLGAASLLWGQAASPFVSGAWSGNVTPTSGTVCIRLTAPGQRVRVAVSTSEQLTAPVFSGTVTSAATAGNVVSLDIGGLQPNTAYFYGIEVNGTLRTEAISRGRFRTFPQGAASFKIALVGDTDYRDGDHRAADAVVAEQPLLLLFNGDLHYSDIGTTNPDDYREAFDNTLKHPNLGPLLRSAPIAYVWDDHDFAGGNDTNGNAVGGPAVRTAFREYVPHYPLTVGDGTIGQAFSIGRVRIIMTDLRSASMPTTTPESASKTRLGTVQKAWFKQELLNARDAGFPLILWLCTDPWIAPADLNDDTWGGYTTERAEIANFLKDNRIRNVVAYCGDMHAMAYDDGEHSDYATGGGAPLIVLHAAALSHPGNTKGGPYSAGPYPESQQYGILEVIDTGGPSIQCRFTAKRVGEGVKLAFNFTSSVAGTDSRTAPPVDANADRALINISARTRIASAGETFIAGFVIGGRSTRNVLMRAVGPSLSAFGVTGILPRPALTLFRGTTVVATNDDWGSAGVTRFNAAFDRAGAFRLASPGSRDAAMYLTLEPGGYTLQTSSAEAGGTGNFLVEIYEVP